MGQSIEREEASLEPAAINGGHGVRSSRRGMFGHAKLQINIGEIVVGVGECLQSRDSLKKASGGGCPRRGGRRRVGEEDEATRRSFGSSSEG